MLPSKTNAGLHPTKHRGKVLTLWVFLATLLFFLKAPLRLKAFNKSATPRPLHNP